MKLTPIKSNMTEVNIKGTTILFSYSTPVACHVIGKGYLKTSKKWSATTSKHINQWLKMNDAKSVQEVPQETIQHILDLDTQEVFI